MRSLCTVALVVSCMAVAAQDALADGANGSANAYFSAPALLPVSDAPAGRAQAAAYTSERTPATVLSTIAPSLPAKPVVNGDDKNAYNDAASSGWGDSCGCQKESCDCGCNCCTTWFASVSGLVMTRDNPNRFWTTFETGNNPNQLLNTQDAESSWSGGVEARIGRCCGCNGSWEAVYWGIYGMNGEAFLRSDTNELSTPIDVGNGVTINGNPAGDFFDNAREHRITRDDEFHNVELNWLVAAGGAGNMDIQWLAGFRYFRFEETLTFASLAGTAPVGAVFGDDPSLEAYLDTNVENNLWGFQIGARADYNFNSRCRSFFAPKVGLFGNHMSARTSLHDGDGFLGFDLGDSKDDVSFLAQIDLGLAYDLSSRWTVFGGYRAVAITGVALADNQIPPFLAAADEFADVDSNGSLILHGAFGGVEYRW